jgi:hypothetical protein
MSTIKEIKGWPVGTIIPNLTAMAKIVFQRKTGEGQYGPWSVQGVILADSTGDEIQASCWQFDDLSYLKGTEVSVAAAGKNLKTGKTQGVELVEGKGKDGTPRLELKVSHKTGGFIGGDKPSPASTTPAAPQTAIPSHSSHSAPQPVSGASFDERMAKMATLYKHCLFYAGISLNGSKLTDPESLRNVATSLFIEANKSGLGANPPEFKPEDDVAF